MPRTKTDRATPSLIDPPRMTTEVVASVVLLKPIDRVYSYLVPGELVGRLAPGMRVRVAFGRRERLETAFCIEVSARAWDSTLKPIIEVIDEQPVIGPKLLELGRWIARYYCSHLGRTLDLMVPAAAKSQAGWRKVRYATLVGTESDERKALPRKQAAAIEALQVRGGRLAVSELCGVADCTPAVIASLVKKGLLAMEIVREPVEPGERNDTPPTTNFELTPDQKAAINQIGTAVAAREFSVQVLYGVTGSGKTEVYVSAIRQALSEGRQAILLVPEIALTTQTYRRLQLRFERVVCLHSGLSDVERSRAWAAVAAGQIPVVIGTRSAVFAPCPNLGVIVVDEEAEPSYKNQGAPRYHTRDVAIQRAHLEGIPVVLGSATPSLETWKNVKTRPHFHLIRMPTRVRGLAMPSVYLVDMRDEHLIRPGVHMLSQKMEAHLAATFNRKEQAVLLLNRRGYAGFLHCPRCKAVITCPHCSVHMVFHATTHMAHCHYCHTKSEIPTYCPTAGCQGKLVRFGIGTQRVEEELHNKFPAAKVRRMDSDAMRRPKDYADVLGAFERKEFDVLVGTQMIAKGLDFPFVSFVGVISADTALSLNDFRSEERTFQLVLQVAGRSGRGDLPGHVVVQTFAADTAPIQHAVKGDYQGFADLELEKRRDANLPPWTRLVRIVLGDTAISRLKTAAESMRRNLDEILQRRAISASVFGPFPAPISRIRDKYRYDIQLTFATAAAMLEAMDAFKSEGALKAAVKSVTIDVDPVSLQ